MIFLKFRNSTKLMRSNTVRVFPILADSSAMIQSCLIPLIPLLDLMQEAQLGLIV